VRAVALADLTDGRAAGHELGRVMGMSRDSSLQICAGVSSAITRYYRMESLSGSDEGGVPHES